MNEKVDTQTSKNFRAKEQNLARGIMTGIFISYTCAMGVFAYKFHDLAESDIKIGNDFEEIAQKYDVMAETYRGVKGMEDWVIYDEDQARMNYAAARLNKENFHNLNEGWAIGTTVLAIPGLAASIVAFRKL